MRTRVKLTLQNGPMKGDFWVFSKPGDCVVGSAGDCAVQISANDDFATVSGHHCKLDISPPNIWVRDLVSRNGTFINGRRISSSEDELNLLQPGDILAIGPLAFSVEIDEDPTEDTHLASDWLA